MNYEFTGETKDWGGRTLYRIRATVDMPQHGVKAGDLGGWIESEKNLSGNAWVYGNAQVYDNALVYDTAQVSGNALVYDNALVYGGKWEFSPLQIQSTQYFVNIAGIEDGEYTLRIGCQIHTLSWWLANNHDFATQNGYESFEDEAMLYIKLACEWAKLHPAEARDNDEKC